MKRILFFLLTYLCFASHGQAGSETWRSHLMFSSVTQVAETPDKVFGLSDGSLFSYNKSNQKIDLYSKANGLSDNKVTQISFNDETNILVVIYDNTNIDLINNEGKIFNVPDIMNKNMTSDKTINDIYFSQSKAYLSTGFGISTIDLLKHEISDTYLIKKKTLSTAILNDQIYAATDQGIMISNLNSNPIDPNSWSLCSNLKANDLAVFQNNLIAVVSKNGLYKITPTTSQQISTNTNFTNIFVANNILVAFGQYQLSLFSNLTQETVISGSNFYGISSLAPNSSIWHAASTSGLNRIDKSTQGYQKITLGIKPNGPIANSPYHMRFSGNRLIVTGGGAWDNNFDTKGYLFFYDNNNWSYLKVDTISAQGRSPRDFLDAIEDPNEPNHIYVASFGEGVYEFRNGKFVKLHDHTNSGIETYSHPAIPPGTNHYDRTDGLCYDKSGNLFVGNHGVSNTIKCLTKEGQWIGFPFTPIANKPGIVQILQSKSGLYWVVNARSLSGLFVFDTKGTLGDFTDDKYKYFSSVTYLDESLQKSITPHNYYCIVEDKNGAIWAGSDQGPIIISNPSTVFNDDFLCSRIKIPRNDGTNLSDFFLASDRIRAMAVDNLNNKWIGTEANGVYQVNSNGQQTLHHFTSDNSPLLSNKILSIAIHPTTGEVFIGTDKGLVSYSNDNNNGQKGFSEVYAYPNPVRPEFNGVITITGIKNGAIVRITDLNNNKIFEGVAENEQIAWSGRSMTGERLPTGMYLVYAKTSNTLECLVTKVFIVK